MVRALDFGNQGLGSNPPVGEISHPGVTVWQLAVSSLLDCTLLVVAYVLCESASRPFLVEHW